LRKKVAVHCHGDQAAKEAIEAGVDSIEHGSFMKPETLTLMKNKGTYLTPNVDGDGMDHEQMTTTRHAAARRKRQPRPRSDMFRNAVKWCVKVHSELTPPVFPHGQNAKEFKLMVNLGNATHRRTERPRLETQPPFRHRPKKPEHSKKEVRRS